MPTPRIGLLLLLVLFLVLTLFSTIIFKGSILVVQHRYVTLTDHVNGTGRSRNAHRPPPPAPALYYNTSVNCQKRILILADVKGTKSWVGFDPRKAPWNAARYQDDVYRTKYECCTTRDCNNHLDNCTIELTFSTNTEQMHGKDAVVFNIVPSTLNKNIDKLINTDKNQSIDQLWVFYTRETPLSNYLIHLHRKLAKFPVHVIWSYTSDCGLHVPYWYYQPRLSTTNSSKKHVISGQSKTKLVAWMGSNCHGTFWPRMQFVQELQKYIKLDTYGGCGNLTCQRNSDECSQLMSSYKFYLSIENAECEEYITEKLWRNALQRGVVPIVYGAPRESYEKLAPPNSFIYAADFKSVKSLAEYIIELDKRPEVYRKFFEWHDQGSIRYDDALSPKKLCRDVLPLIEQLRYGKLEKKPISTYPWFNSCRIHPFNYKHFPSFHDWKPW